MFSYVINNPNNLSIQNDNYFTIPFGHRCTSALACKFAGIRSFSLPFDWNIPLFPKNIQNVLENNFEDFIPDVYNGIFDNKYGFLLVHFNPNINDGVEEYKRRIDRFNHIMSQPKKKYFIYINEDYLYDNRYRQDDFNDKNFNEMLELEKLMKNKYINIDYNILYFNFKHHNIPRDSNIINIVLHTTNVYNSNEGVSTNELRKYCGKILSELFNTNLNVNYDYDSVFNN